MLLFYSDFCPHCRMLLETIARHDTQKLVKTVSVESIRAAGKEVSKRIHSVPAMMIFPAKDILFGKEVFDYLLLPGRGKLLQANAPSSPGAAGARGGDAADGPGANPVVEMRREPSAFSLSTLGGISEAFSELTEMGGANTETNMGYDDYAYGWTSLKQGHDEPVISGPVAEETRAKKEPLNVEAILASRESDVRDCFADTKKPDRVGSATPPMATRV